MWSKSHRHYLKNKAFLRSIMLGFLLLTLSITITFFAIVYATKNASNAVTDIILSNIPVFDVGNIFLYAPLLFWATIIVHVLVYDPKKLPFVLKSVALFHFIRSAFIILTHIAPYPSGLNVDISGIIEVFTRGGDLFFSSHTGLPFLMALVFWEEKPLRYFSLFSSIFFGTIVLLGHLHYSIDVFSAFFITYTIFRIAERLFWKDWQSQAMLEEK